MIPEEFDRLLFLLCHSNGITATRLNSQAFQLHETGSPAKKQFYFGYWCHENNVFGAYCFLPIAKVMSSSALADVLKMNRGGVGGTEFFFSCVERNGELALLLEAQFLDSCFDDDTLEALFGRWLLGSKFCDELVLPTDVNRMY